MQIYRVNFMDYTIKLISLLNTPNGHTRRRNNRAAEFSR